MSRKPADPEEELRWMSQEVRGYVEAVDIQVQVSQVEKLHRE